MFVKRKFHLFIIIELMIARLIACRNNRTVPRYTVYAGRARKSERTRGLYPCRRSTTAASIYLIIYEIIFNSVKFQRKALFVGQKTAFLWTPLL